LTSPIYLKALERSLGEDLGDPNTMLNVPRGLEFSRVLTSGTGAVMADGMDK
jgi:hypothetical protein